MKISNRFLPAGRNDPVANKTGKTLKQQTIPAAYAARLLLIPAAYAARLLLIPAAYAARLLLIPAAYAARLLWIAA
jgi:hypothetical protein